MSRRKHTPVTVAGAAVLVTVLAGCSQQTTSGELTNTGVFTGYEINNQNDIGESRKDRLDYRDFE